MSKHVLILGGQGRIGSSVARDLLNHTQVHLTVTGKHPGTAYPSQLPSDRCQVLQLDLADTEKLATAIATADLVIHCAGPFHHRDAGVLQQCIRQGVDYLDVSDNVRFTRKVLACRAAAAAAGVTAIVNTGIFPGISNSMVRQGVEQLDQADEIRLSYVVGGSGGAGLTVLRTTFLGLLQPFDAWIDGKWHKVHPYSDREPLHLPPPYNTVHVYWYEMPETFTLAEAFPVKTVVTKFGSVPDFYNHLTWIAAHVFPKSWIRHPGGTEFLSQVSYRMTQVSDRLSGIGVGIRCDVVGQRHGQPVSYYSTLVHHNTAVIAGYGTGSIAELVLAGTLQKPGVWAVEEALSTELFQQTMQSRGIEIQQGWGEERLAISD
ncbi:MAG: NAD(P)H-binding protein [Leptolyngbyaceae cyanobacterium SL_7_1]|nr:NAD(P)H-binding protein [Leptolyngbyaceae cyanobacterium SL_7_1]